MRFEQKRNKMQLVYVVSQDEILKCADVVFALCEESYRPIGGFKSLANKSDFGKRVNLLKLSLEDKDNGEVDIGACGLYRFINDGYKAIGYASNKRVPGYLKCMQSIIQDDINKFDQWYWVESSHAIAHLFEKQGGYAIPNIYVLELTGHAVTESDLMPDGFGYRRKIGVGDAATDVIKYMYGFMNRDTYNELMSIYGSLDNFVTEILKMKEPDKHLFESLENIPDSLPKEIRARIMFVYNFDDCIAENDVYEYPQTWLDALNNAMRILKKYYINHPVRAVEEAINLGNDILGRVTVLELHQFKAPPPVPHVEI